MKSHTNKLLSLNNKVHPFTLTSRTYVKGRAHKLKTRRFIEHRRHPSSTLTASLFTNYVTVTTERSSESASEWWVRQQYASERGRERIEKDSSRRCRRDRRMSERKTLWGRVNNRNAGVSPGFSPSTEFGLCRRTTGVICIANAKQRSLTLLKYGRNPHLLIRGKYERRIK